MRMQAAIATGRDRAEPPFQQMLVGVESNEVGLDHGNTLVMIVKLFVTLHHVPLELPQCIPPFFFF